jgi:hypothetical protein
MILTLYIITSDKKIYTFYLLFFGVNLAADDTVGSCTLVDATLISACVGCPDLVLGLPTLDFF